LEEYKRKFPNFEAHFMSAEETKLTNWHHTIKQFVLKELKNRDENAEFILTTRLDNDDAIHLSFVDSVQKYVARHQEEAIINYPNGLQYIPQYNVLKNITYPYSHFCTLVEKNNQNIRTVLGFPHTELPSSFKNIFLKTRTRMWLEVIHSKNVINTAFFQFRHLISDLFLIGFQHRNLNDFGINQPVLRFNFDNWKLFFKWLFGKCKEKTTGK